MPQLPLGPQTQISDKSTPWIAVRLLKQQPTEDPYLGNSTYFAHQKVNYSSLLGVIGLASIGMVASFGMTRRRPR